MGLSDREHANLSGVWVVQPEMRLGSSRLSDREVNNPVRVMIHKCSGVPSSATACIADRKVKVYILFPSLMLLTPRETRAKYLIQSLSEVVDRYNAHLRHHKDYSVS
jgi:hypothetical protein